MDESDIKTNVGIPTEESLEVKMEIPTETPTETETETQNDHNDTEEELKTDDVASPNNENDSNDANEGGSRFTDSRDKIKLHHIFLFCNPTSGGNQAAKLMEIDIDQLRFHHALLPEDSYVHVYFYNLKKKEEKLQGFHKLGQLVHDTPQGEEVIAIAAGGDGTVKWVLGELRKPGVDALGKIPIGVIPFGTGNDLARVMEWGSTAPVPLIGFGLSALKDTLVQFAVAERKIFDVWNVQLEVDEANGGTFYVVENGKVVPRPDGKKIVEEEMINYFSLGADAQAVFSFEQNRKTSQFANKLQFAIEGSKLSSPFNRPQPLQALGLESVKRDGGIDLTKPSKGSKSPKSPNITSTTSATSTSDPEDEGQVVEKQQVPLTKPMSGLVMQNIPSYSAGSNFWGPPKKNSPFRPQNVGDGLLEMMQLRSLIDIGLYKASAGAAGGLRKLAQAKAFSLGFKQNGSEVEIYYQVDGEGYKAVGLKKVEVSHAFKVTILKRRHPASEMLASPKMLLSQIEKQKKKGDKKGFNIIVPIQGQVFKRSNGRNAWKIRHAAILVSKPNESTNRPEVTLCMYRKRKRVMNLKLKYGQVLVLPYDRIPEKERVWVPSPTSTLRVTIDGTIKRPVWLCASSEDEAAKWLETLTNSALWE